MEMKAVVKYFPTGEADVKAFLAGNDIIELSENSARAINLIRKAVRKGKITKEEFEARVKKVLAAKYWAGLNHYHENSTDHLTTDLNRPAAKELVQQLSDAAVTLLKGDTASLYLNPLQKTAIISIGVTQPTVFQQELAKRYPDNTIFLIGKNTPDTELKTLLENLGQYEQVFVSINDTRPRPASKLDYSSDVKLFISKLAEHGNTVMSVFANAYAIAGLTGIEKSGALLVCYQLTNELQLSAVKVITRQLKPKGRLSVSINKFFTTGTGISL